MFSAFFRNSHAADEADDAIMSVSSEAIHDRMIRMLRQREIYAATTIPDELQTPMAVKKAAAFRQAFAA